MKRQLINAIISIREAEAREIYFGSTSGAAGYIVDVYSVPGNVLLSSYVFIPWQDLYSTGETERPISTSSIELQTVTAFSIVYNIPAAIQTGEEDRKTLKGIKTYFDSLLEINKNNRVLIENKGITLPDGVQVISLKEMEHYVDLYVAESGSGNVHPEMMTELFPGKMILLHQVPDAGPVKTNWIAPLKGAKTDDFWRIRSILENDFQTHEELVEFSLENNRFPDYSPKESPDEVLDYMPQLSNAISELPAAELANLLPLIEDFGLYSHLANEMPGTWEEGNMVLGARDKEYRPSENELILAEVGSRIKSIIEANSTDDIRSTVMKIQDMPEILNFTQFRFIHYDVMGSGRFFYVDSMKELSIDLSSFKSQH